MTKVIVCDDHPMMANGIKSLFDSNTVFQFVGQSHSVNSTLKLIEREQPHLLLLDLNLKTENGFAVLEKVKDASPTLKVAILTMYEDASLIEKAKLLGANGFITKDTDDEELLGLLEQVMSHTKFIESVTAQRKHKANTLFRDQFVEKMRITKREVEIIWLIAQGKHAQEIADQLFLSPHTVNTHRKNILKKLNLSSVAELVKFAFENKLIN